MVPSAWFKLSLLLLAVSISVLHSAVVPQSPTDLCAKKAKNSTEAAKCPTFHSCCETQCGGQNFTATCSEERSFIGTCICKGTGSNVSTSTVKPGQCGKSAVPPKVPKPGRIVGGEEAKANSWPWQVSLKLSHGHNCGGSLVDSTHVITAAHCIRGHDASDYKVLAGLHDQEAPQSSYQVISAANLTEHPNYNPSNHSSDIAIITLASPIQFNANVTPICIAEDDPDVGKVCITTGWGTTHGTGDRRYLQQVALPMVPNAVCNDSDHYNGRIDDTMNCAGVTGKDSCQGDSGGPMVCQRADGIWELQGVTSWGEGCGRENRPGLYARVVYFKDWLKANTNA